ncbi:MAG: hypothetical protein IPJ48_17555 [Propionivibrio sp.]|uniref:Uncharacterized protein n=1 Tax=Candidatus Propionivibrio dominans TaxID=2954373 RepID=A0A9D7FFK8_9RHOO|nr:hypothetical protein [Candidatus Propionivibrio dominans]
MMRIALAASQRGALDCAVTGYGQLDGKPLWPSINGRLRLKADPQLFNPSGV